MIALQIQLISMMLLSFKRDSKYQGTTIFCNKKNSIDSIDSIDSISP